MIQHATSVTSDLKYYNANSKNSRTGDCVVRSISLAFNKDYDETHRELNAWKRKLGWTKYNVAPVYEEYINDLGIQNNIEDLSELGLPEDTTVIEFTETMAQGTFILLVGKTHKFSDHMVAVIDGTAYDSWDCSNYLVNRVYLIKEEPSSKVEPAAIIDYIVEIKEYALNYLNTIQVSKSPYFEFYIDEVDSYKMQGQTYAIRFVCQITDESILDVVGRRPGRRPNVWAAKSFVVKFVPTVSAEYNVDRSESKLRDQLREWAWSCRHAVEENLEYDELVTNSKFVGNKPLLLKIPNEFRSKVLELRDRGSNDNVDRYYMLMEADPADPRYDDESEVSFYAENLRELKYQLSEYSKDFSRYGFDY